MDKHGKPLVSVLISCYNHAPYIEDCLNSIFRQTYDNIELIVIDDGSTDDSAQLIESLRLRHDFYFERQSNMGFARTLNKMLALAKGKYIAAFDSDDIMMIEKLDKQVAFMESRPDIAVCGGNFLTIDARGELLRNQRLRPYRELDFDDVFLNRRAGIASSTALIRRAVIEREGGYDPNIRLQDAYMWLKLTSRGHRIAILNDVLVHYRKHAQNIHKNLRFMVECKMRTLDAYRNHPHYPKVVGDYLGKAFCKAAKSNRIFASELLRKMPYRGYFSGSFLKGMLYYLLRRA